MNNLKEVKIPFSYYGKTLLVLALLVFATSLYITYVFQPHDVSDAKLRIPYFAICVVHSIVPSFLFVVLFSLVKSLGSKRTEEWNIVNEFIAIMSLILLIGVIHFLIRDLLYKDIDNWSMRFLLEEVVNTLIIGLAIAIFIITAKVAIVYKQNLAKAEHLIKKVNLSNFDLVDSSQETIAIDTPLKGEKFTLELNNFMYAETSGNYIEIYSKNLNVGLSKKLIRMTLSSFREQLLGYEQIVRTHKRYLVNISQIAKVQGNTAGLVLNMKDFPAVQVPVSRKNIPSFELAFSAFLEK